MTTAAGCEGGGGVVLLLRPFQAPDCEMSLLAPATQLVKVLTTSPHLKQLVSLPTVQLLRLK